ncbi:unnamed protein product [Paramecium octaurelia]|uniref:Uncharacterized protein n=1 Tax=Paramecium octaurelia TaxID=43137 RepID=A0A8S1W1K9_PAROT|nr:unnamed protein product [Paramecium octaurelia]
MPSDQFKQIKSWFHTFEKIDQSQILYYQIRCKLVLCLSILMQDLRHQNNLQYLVITW